MKAWKLKARAPSWFRRRSSSSGLDILLIARRQNGPSDERSFPVRWLQLRPIDKKFLDLLNAAADKMTAARFAGLRS
jgi:hypothetical protein